MQKFGKLTTAMLIGLFGVGGTVAVNGTTASAKTKAAKIVSYTNIKNTKVHATKGTIYTSAKLSKVAHYAKNYKTYTFTRTNQAKVKKNNGKVAIYQYIKSSNGKVKGWIWHNDLKDGPATKSSSAKATAVTSEKVHASFRHNYENGNTQTGPNDIPSYLRNFSPMQYKAVTPKSWYKNFVNKSTYKKALSESKKIKGIKKGTVTGMHYVVASGYVAQAKLTNGHMIFWDTGYPKNATEYVPGLYQYTDMNNIISKGNHSGHYVVYYLNDWTYQNDNVSDHESETSPFGNHYKLPAGFKYDDVGRFPAIVEGGAIMYNPSSKIIFASAQSFQDDFCDADADES